jgi:hypothetical protein
MAATSAVSISTQQARLDTKSDGSSGSPRTERISLSGLIDIDDTRTLNEFLDREINSLHDPRSLFLRIVAVVSVVATIALAICSTIFLSASVPIWLHVYYIALPIAATACAISIFSNDEYAINLHERESFELMNCKAALANREFIDFVKTTLKSSKLYCKQLKGLYLLFKDSELNKKNSVL